MIKRCSENLRGIYRLDQWSNDDFRKLSNPSESIFDFSVKAYVNAPQGLTYYKKNNPEIIIHRTRLGYLFPMLKYVSLEDGPVLRPLIYRKFFGFLLLVFLALFVCVGIVMCFQYPIQMVPIIWSFIAFTLFVFWLGTKVEYYFDTWGFRKLLPNQ